MKITKYLIKCGIVIAALLLFWQIGPLVLGNESDKKLPYDQFVSEVNNVMEHLSKKYKTIIPTAQHYTVYPGNPDMKWSKNKVDAIDDDLSKGTTKEIFIVDEGFMTKVGFYYQPWISGKHYASVNRIDNTTNKRLGTEMTFPRLYSNSFTADGFFIQVTTFQAQPVSLERSHLSEKELELKMVSKNGEITSTIQEYFLNVMVASP
ncbi:hypothetical protein E8L90_25550 [Brevibacillus antibioticus]|uniref:Uncharacterized protein n=1 Tax=Brevibacillus antibioticus TaxID=2570228 RepID=A0A4U2YCI8_9BACL|nr:hypothetical protein [Brevibacillus antibioticus]TKI58489.1 hypothetical protein E8L90_25550 [Brevibacillus antibioticus]